MKFECEHSSDIGKLLLRICVGALMLPHGIMKLPFNEGIERSAHLLASNHIPEFFAYGAYFGEIIAPLLILLGFKARLGGILVVFTMLFAITVTSGWKLFGLNAFGGFNGELQLLYIFASLGIVFLGAGKYSITEYFKLNHCACCKK